MSKIKKILIISFYFPPYDRVGGRRWAKHAKYLVAKGIDVGILCGDFRDLSVQGHWIEDTETYKNNIVRLPLIRKKNPYFKRKLPSNLSQKLFWKASYYWDCIIKPIRRNSRGDESFKDVENFYKTSERLLTKSSFSHVLLSVGPFSYSAILPRLKKKFPDLKYIIDFRDRWLEENHQLFSWQKRHQLKLMNKIISSVDITLAVNQSIENDILKLSPDIKTATLMHAVDLDIKTVVHTTTIDPTSYIHLIYGGELYEGLAEEVELCSEFVSQLASRHSNGAIASFYLHYSRYDDVFQRSEHLHYMPKVEPSVFITKLLTADLLLLFRPFWSLDSFSSKFFELVAMRKPILYFGHSSMVSEYISTNNLGWHVQADNIGIIVSKVLENLSSKKIPDKMYDSSQHSFENRTNELIRILESI